MDVNGRKGKREKSFNGLSARPASCSCLPLSLSLLSPPFQRLDPHRYLDGRTNAANRKPNNLGHFWQTTPSKCNSTALAHSLGPHPRLEFQVAANLPRDPSATISPSLSSYSDFLLVRSFRLCPTLLPFQPWRDLTRERDWRPLSCSVRVVIVDFHGVQKNSRLPLLAYLLYQLRTMARVYSIS